METTHIAIVGGRNVRRTSFRPWRRGHDADRLPRDRFNALRMLRQSSLVINPRSCPMLQHNPDSVLHPERLSGQP
jgi:hypothetical protein